MRQNRRAMLVSSACRLASWNFETVYKRPSKDRRHSHGIKMQESPWRLSTMSCRTKIQATRIMMSVALYQAARRYDMTHEVVITVGVCVLAECSVVRALWFVVKVKSKKCLSRSAQQKMQCLWQLPRVFSGLNFSVLSLHPYCLCAQAFP